MCVAAACSCPSVGDCACFCDVIAAYAEACSERGVSVSWRSNDLCRECKEILYDPLKQLSLLFIIMLFSGWNILVYTVVVLTLGSCFFNQINCYLYSDVRFDTLKINSSWLTHLFSALLNTAGHRPYSSWRKRPMYFGSANAEAKFCYAVNKMV